MKNCFFVFFLFVSIFRFDLYAEPTETENCISEYVCFVVKDIENGFDLYIKNRNPTIFPTNSVMVKVTVKNFKSEHTFPQFLVLKGNESVFVSSFVLEDITKPTFTSFAVHVMIGDRESIHDDSVTYLLPFPAGIRSRVAQAYNGKFSHIGNLKYSVDFILPVGTPILAARKGQVVAVVSNFSEGGIRKDLLSKANYIIILHNDGTLGNYAHLMKDGVLVKVGDFVDAGQMIGYSGNTGFTQGPHLHFEVHKPTRQLDVMTIPTVFKTQNAERETLSQHYLYWHPKDGDLPLRTDILDEDIRLCKYNDRGEKIRCGDTSFRLGENYAIEFEFAKPKNQEIEIHITKDGNSVKPFYYKWKTQNYLDSDSRYFVIPKNEEFIGQWKMRVRINGEEKKTLFFEVNA